MNLDEQFSDNVDKQMLIQLVNENVIRFQTENTLKHTLNKIRTPGLKNLGVFFISRCKKNY